MADKPTTPETLTPIAESDHGGLAVQPATGAMRMPFAIGGHPWPGISKLVLQVCGKTARHLGSGGALGWRGRDERRR